MQQLSVRDEQDVKELIAQRNDPVTTRLVYELLDLDQSQVQQRIQHLSMLGDRYMVLALLREDGQQDEQTVVSLLERRYRRALSFLAPSSKRDERARAWYQEAENVYSAAVRQSALSEQEDSPSRKDTYAAYSHLAVARAVRGKLDLALVDLTQALNYADSAHQQAEVSYLRGLLSAQQEAFDLALVDFAYALDLVPDSQMYREALDHTGARLRARQLER
ncbi:hypothetical protein KDA_75140 [Dictyobacter alpinus]|uniref:Uncharacterized protein n=1 Tax=Dictyobacter alpinus TaxID=2014873 RepID=A0A402BL39_9CHLR|nr:hypothetical protein [Dictyobacter alpinus]GCE32030.1 hypothetical protein KDA_75140 [Dictyobacter alpinus]